MIFEPKTDKEISDAELWKAGIYEFEITDAQDNTSQSSGNEMIVLRLKISDRSGRTRMITDYLVAQRAAKFRHVAYACGLEAEYEDGEVFAKHFKGKQGRLKLVVDRAKKGFSRRNVVGDYVL